MTPQDIRIINQIIIILINALSLYIAFLIYFSNRRAKTNIYFSLFLVFICLWVDLLFLAVFAPLFLTAENAVLLSTLAARLIFSLTGPVMVSAYFLIVYFLKESARRNFVLEKIFMAMWAFLSIMALANDSVIKYIEIQDVTFKKIVGGYLMKPFLLVSLFFIVFLLYMIVEKYRSLNPAEKEKGRYFLTGMFIMGFVNLVFNSVVPLYSGGNFFGRQIIYNILGGYTLLFMNSLAAYAILNKKLFNIRVLLTQLLVVVMGILLLITPFLVNIPWLKTLLSMVFLLFCVFGWLLVRSSIREVRQKEILEQTVEERTKELRASKHELELNKIELEKKVQELEKWYKLTVGRELRMVELKQKIKELEEDLKGKEQEKKA